MPVMQFWFEYASPYSYVAAARIEKLAAAAGFEIEWRPFLLGPIFQAQGWNDTPAALFPAKGRHMWRDVERLCNLYELPYRQPEIFPQNGVRAARATLVAIDEGFAPDLVRAVYDRVFVNERNIADPAVLTEIIDGLGRDGGEVLARAESPEVRARLRANTEEAMARGIFGAPSFIVGDELFWGSDRLEQALAWPHEGTRGG